jgi:Spy/CpxP family protein refolding chaperone
MIRLRTAALGLAILAGSATIASAQSTTAPGTQAPSARQDRGDRGQRGGWKGEKGHKGQHGMRALFKDNTLTADQKTQVRAISDRYRTQRQSLAESMKPAMTEVRNARQRGDSVAAKAAFDRTADTRSKLTALREQELREVRGVLTAAQQTTFDRNVAAMKTKMEQHRGRGGRRA